MSLDGLVRELRVAGRRLARSWGFACTCLLTFIFTILSGSSIVMLGSRLLFASLPVPNANDLFEVSAVDEFGSPVGISVPMFEELRRRTSFFAKSFLWSGGGLDNVQMNGVVFAGAVDKVDGDYYGTLQISPALGRWIDPQEAGQPGRPAAAVAVIGYRAWQERYHGAPDVVGKTLLLSGRSFTIIGVHPASYSGLIREEEADVTVPLAAYIVDPVRFYDRRSTFYTLVGRLKTGVSEAEARANLLAVWPGILKATAPLDEGVWRRGRSPAVQLKPEARGVSYLRERFGRPIYLLMAAVAILALLACVNLSSLALARALRGEQEFRIRVALGCGKWPLMCTSIAEALCIALVGVGASLPLATVVADRTSHFIWPDASFSPTSAFADWRALGFALGAAIFLCVPLVAVPAWFGWRGRNAGTLHVPNARTVVGRATSGRLLSGLQFALSFAILSACLLFVHSIRSTIYGSPGFESEHLLIASLIPQKTYAGLDKSSYALRLVDRLREIPGVAAAGLSHAHPVGVPWKRLLAVPPAAVNYYLVSPDYFTTLGVPVLHGREFEVSDDVHGPGVAMVGAGLARRLADSGGVLGRHVRIEGSDQDLRIVGVVADAGLGDPHERNPLNVYAPILQDPSHLGWATAVIRTVNDPKNLTSAFRRAIVDLGREYPLRIETVRDELDRLFLPEISIAMFTGVFGLALLAIAAIGFHGLISYTLIQRTREIGVRTALGATSSALAKQFASEVAVILGAGIAVGFVSSVFLDRFASHFLYGAPHFDLAAAGVAAVFLVVVGCSASVLPVLRAACIQPSSALRSD